MKSLLVQWSNMGRAIHRLLLCAYLACDGIACTKETVCGPSVLIITKITKPHLDRKFFLF